MLSRISSFTKQFGASSVYHPLPMSDGTVMENDTPTRKADGVIHKEVKKRWVQSAPFYIFLETV